MSIGPPVEDLLSSTCDATGTANEVTMRTNVKNSDYIPALKYSWLTRFYDPVVALTTRENVFRQKLLEQADFNAGERVLDLACGTGTFVVLVKASHPDVAVTGLDGDPGILTLARKKAEAAGMDVGFDEGMSFALPYAGGDFDIVFSSLFFHHLATEDKIRTLKEVIRVLKPGGAFHVCDWGPPANRFSSVKFTAVRLLDGFDVTRDSIDGRLPVFIQEAGFCDIRLSGHVKTMLGTLVIMTAYKPRE